MKIKYNGKQIRNKVGSNQYVTKRKYRNDVGSHLIFFIALIANLTAANYYFTNDFPPRVHAEIISPLASQSAQLEVLPLPQEANPILAEEESEYNLIKKEIYEVFGKHADKAMKVLSCENASLNPEAVNTVGNSPAGSRDMGVFQINEYWQKVNGKFLLDPSINIRIAYKIFTDNGNSFERWTCGRKFGI